MSERSFAGFTYDERLSVGFYGEIYRGAGPGGDPVWVVRIDDDLAEQSGFSDSLIHFGRALGMVTDDHTLATHKTGIGDDGALLVVGEAVVGGRSLESVLNEIGDEPIPSEIAIAIFRGVLESLAKAHSVGLCHAGVHPRSVIVDERGVTRLGDYAPARALAAAAEEDNSLLDATRDFLAPEVGKPGGISPQGDVFSAGILFEEMLGGGGDEARQAVRDLILGAIEGAPGRRFKDAGVLLRELNKVVADAKLRIARPEKVAAYCAHKSGVERASLGMPGRDSGTGETAARVEEALAALEDEISSDHGLDAIVSSLESDVAKPSGPRFPRAKPKAQPLLIEAAESPEIMRARRKAEQAAVQTVPAAEEDEIEHDVTEVEDVDALLQQQRDPISEIISLEGAPTHADLGDDDDDRDPEEEAAAARAAALAIDSLDASGALDALEDDLEDELEDEALAPAPAEEPATAAPTAAEPEPDALVREVQVPAKAAVEPPAVTADPLEGLVLEEPKSSGTFMWLALAMVVMGGGFGYLYTQTDVFHPERAAEKVRQREQANRDEEARLIAAQDKPGDVVVKSAEGEAAVWLLLGKTPLDTFKLPASAPSDLRFELAGHEPLDIAVTGVMWSEKDGELSASVHARMTATEQTPEERGPLSAFPPDPEKAPPPGPDGQGQVHVESTPPGASVWLLVGFTPEVRLAGVAAGKDYEFKVLKDGFEPSGVKFAAADWYLSGAAGVGKMHPELSSEVLLKTLPKASKSGPKGKKSGK